MSQMSKSGFSSGDLPSNVGDVVCWKGIAAHFFSGQTGLVLELRLNKDGISILESASS
jgi:hypothetical protein